MTPQMTARQRRIMDLLTQRGFHGTKELAVALGVSDMTVRRDLRPLAASGTVRVVHGGVGLPHNGFHVPGFSGRVDEDAVGKATIAASALDFVHPGDAIVIDAGTTCLAFALTLPASFAGKIITHSVPVLQRTLSLAAARTIGLGGELLHDSQAFVGEAAVDTLKTLRATTAFVGLAALDEHGLYIERELERSIKCAVMESAKKVVVLAAASKFGHTAMVRLGGLQGIDVLITDAAPPPDVLRALRRAHVQVVVAEA